MEAGTNRWSVSHKRAYCCSIGDMWTRGWKAALDYNNGHKHRKKGAVLQDKCANRRTQRRKRNFI